MDTAATLEEMEPEMEPAVLARGSDAAFVVGDDPAVEYTRSVLAEYAAFQAVEVLPPRPTRTPPMAMEGISSKPRIELPLMISDVKVRELCSNFFDAICHLLDSPVFNSGLDEILRLPRPEWKTGSNNGFVWFPRGRGRDLGNYFYTVVWQTCWYLVMKKEPFAQQKGRMLLLAEKYTSLADKHVNTEEALSMKGDAIEFILSPTKFTGPCMDVQSRRERDEVTRLFRLLWKLWESMLKRIDKDPDGFPPASFMPDPRNMAQLMGLSWWCTKLSTKEVEKAFACYAQLPVQTQRS